MGASKETKSEGKKRNPTCKGIKKNIVRSYGLRTSKRDWNKEEAKDGVEWTTPCTIRSKNMEGGHSSYM